MKMIKVSKIFLLTILAFFTFISCEKQVSKSVPVTPEPPGANLTIKSNPEGAQIYLNGKTTGLTTPDSITWLEIQNYSVTLKKDLYLDTTFSVDVNAESSKDLLIDYTLNPRMYGSISCQTNPDHAEIFLNGKSTGKYTPDIISSLLPGDYTVEYRLANARTDSIVTTVKSSKHVVAVVYLVDTTYWVDYNTHTSDIPNFSYTKILIDNNDIIWLSSPFNGLTKFDGKNWTIYSKENSGLASNNISQIKFGPNGEMWICTDAGINVFNGSTWNLYNVEQNGLPSNFTTDVTFDIDGSPIIATNKGLAHLKNNQWEIITFDLKIPNSVANDPKVKENLNFFTGVDVDNSGNWWATRLQNGVAYWNGSVWQQFFTFLDPDADAGGVDPDINYKSVTHDSDNTIWFALDANPLNGRIVGLSSYSNGQFDKSTYSTFNATAIYSIKMKNGNEKWICTERGIYRFVNYSNIKQYFKGNTPLVTNDIQDIAFDSKGDAWVVTSFNGIYRFKLSKL